MAFVFLSELFGWRSCMYYLSMMVIEALEGATLPSIHQQADKFVEDGL